MGQEIDIDKIVRSRAGSKARFIPRFATNWLARFIHQDFLNTYLRTAPTGVDFCTGTVNYLKVTLSVEGLDSLPADGRFTFVSNHPLGAIDGVALGSIIGNRYDGRIKYLVNDLLMNLEGLAPICVPINKIGKQAKGMPQAIEQVFNSDNHVIMFPAGLCSRRQPDGSIRDLEWRPTFIKQSVRTQRDIIPIHFIAQNSDRFYNVARWCKRLHLPNIAMAYLPDEMWRAQGGHFRVIFGTPIPWQRFDRSRTPRQWAQWVQDTIYSL